LESLIDNLAPATVVAVIVWMTTSLVIVLTLGVVWLRPSYPGWRTWAVGHTALVLGLLISTVREPATLFLSVMLGNGLIMLGITLLLLAFERFAETSRRPVRVYVLGLAVVLAGLLILTVFDQMSGRMILISAYVSWLNVEFTGLLLGQIRQRTPLRTAYAVNLGLFWVVNLLILPRAVLIGLGVLSADAFALNWPNLSMYFAVLVLSVGGTFAFSLLHNDRRRMEVQALNAELLALATLDPLTGLLNRRGLSTAWPERFTAVHFLPLWLVALDLDGFKRINDTYGHPLGDQCLKFFAQALRQVIVGKEVASRTGGDEFVLLLSGTEEQIRERMNALQVVLNSSAPGLPSLQASMGWTRIKAGDQLTEAISRADHWMYQVKRMAVNEPQKPQEPLGRSS
jgi:diguanylate cyclase (GGDEF)-like protein